MDQSAETQIIKLLSDISTELKDINSTLKLVSRETNANIDEAVNRLGEIRASLDR